MRIPLVLWAAIQCSGGRQAVHDATHEPLEYEEMFANRQCEPHSKGGKRRIALHAAGAIDSSSTRTSSRVVRLGRERSGAAAGLSPRSRRRRWESSSYSYMCSGVLLNVPRWVSATIKKERKKKKKKTTTTTTTTIRTTRSAVQSTINNSFETCVFKLPVMGNRKQHA